ncbi:mucin-5AC-like [Protopterus annectens]|uniref:mucin-5AC-like n=1 Tax=Protopterus annectens TaxID=7888 RepID=UPI001CF9D327|nr:mucin-5AC-like [Protopterus annectens]
MAQGIKVIKPRNMSDPYFFPFKKKSNFTLFLFLASTAITAKYTGPSTTPSVTTAATASSTTSAPVPSSPAASTAPTAKYTGPSTTPSLITASSTASAPAPSSRAAPTETTAKYTGPSTTTQPTTAATSLPTPSALATMTPAASTAITAKYTGPSTTPSVTTAATASSTTSAHVPSSPAASTAPTAKYTGPSTTPSVITASSTASAPVPSSPAAPTETTAKYTGPSTTTLPTTAATSLPTPSALATMSPAASTAITAKYTGPSTTPSVTTAATASSTTSAPVPSSSAASTAPTAKYTGPSTTPIKTAPTETTAKYTGLTTSTLHTVASSLPTLPAITTVSPAALSTLSKATSIHTSTAPSSLSKVTSTQTTTSMASSTVLNITDCKSPGVCCGPVGEVKYPGDTWTSNCYDCICNKTTGVECKLSECPPKPTCQNDEILQTSQSEGSCCPAYNCKQITCIYNQKEYKLGETWTSGCQDCICSPTSNAVACKPHQCASLPVCSESEKLTIDNSSPDRCCTTGYCVKITCTYNQKKYMLGDTWTSGCQQCTCSKITKSVQCVPQKCPADPICKPDEKLTKNFASGSCCPTTQCVPMVCTFNQNKYKVGESWENKCFQCTCTGSNSMKCSPKSCPPDPVCKPDEKLVKSSGDDPCCLKAECVPAVCTFNQMTYKNGEKWISGCEECTCNTSASSSVQCVTIKCPPDPICEPGEQLIKSGENESCCPASQCQPELCYYNQEEHKYGDQWISECQECNCTGTPSAVQCVHQSCPPDPECKPDEELVIQTGNDSCCPIKQCTPITCQYKGKTYTVGESFVDENDTCLSFQCNVTGLEGNYEHCDHQTYCPKDKRIYSADTCCYVCKDKCLPVPKNVNLNISSCVGDIEMSECHGDCAAYTLTEANDGLNRTCVFCDAVGFQEKIVELTCPDGSKKQHSYNDITSCQCLQCSTKS